MFVWAHTVSPRKPLCFVSFASLIVLAFQSLFPCVCVYAVPRWLSIHLWSRGRLLNVGFCATQRIFKDKDEKTQMESRIWPIKTNRIVKHRKSRYWPLFDQNPLFGRTFLSGKNILGGSLMCEASRVSLCKHSHPSLPNDASMSKRPPKKPAKSANSLLGPKYWTEQFLNNFFSSGTLLKIWQHNVAWKVYMLPKTTWGLKPVWKNKENAVLHSKAARY